MFSYLYHQASLSQDKNIKELELCARSAWALQGAIAEPPLVAHQHQSQCSRCCSMLKTPCLVFPLHGLQKWDYCCQWAYSFVIGDDGWMTQTHIVSVSAMLWNVYLWIKSHKRGKDHLSGYYFLLTYFLQFLSSIFVVCKFFYRVFLDLLLALKSYWAFKKTLINKEGMST